AAVRESELERRPRNGSRKVCAKLEPVVGVIFERGERRIRDNGSKAFVRGKSLDQNRRAERFSHSIHATDGVQVRQQVDPAADVVDFAETVCLDSATARAVTARIRRENGVTGSEQISDV